MNDTSSSNPSRETTRRNPWPIVITVYFVAFFAFVVCFIVFASRQHVDLVRTDYYEAEIKFQQQIDRVERSRPVDAQVAVSYDLQSAKLTVQLPSDSRKGAFGRIELYRPSDSRQDKNIKLAADQNGKQQIDVRDLKGGLWKVRVSWTSSGQEYFIEKPITISNS
ncbi:MAG: nitrogen fixation protein FixH [Verrucomicrobiales bacterium]|nr:nitrogen fixation protein FixH [Verrucomicrobiales bacterium]